mmetsp:Transcript_24617/g.72915  ORF Transcript_24617/g.72915 Transcript_24617/m.72915 type:complete len:149 (-) Transcript_24617:306-752(-)
MTNPNARPAIWSSVHAGMTSIPPARATCERRPRGDVSVAAGAAAAGRLLSDGRRRASQSAVHAPHPHAIGADTAAAVARALMPGAVASRAKEAGTAVPRTMLHAPAANMGGGRQGAERGSMVATMVVAAWRETPRMVAAITSRLRGGL